MKRYQMYLEPVTVDAIDKIAEATSLSRAQIARDVLRFFTDRYGRLIQPGKVSKKKGRHPFDRYIGKFTLGDPEAYRKVDEIYVG